MQRLVVVGALFALVAAPSGAAAGPWDGPRTTDTADGEFLLHPIPRAFTVTWEPGVEDYTTDSAREFRGPEFLDVPGLRLERIRRVGAARMHTEEYRLADEAEPAPGLVATALTARTDVRVAAPLFRLEDAVDAPWRAVTSDILLQLDDAAQELRMTALADELGADAVEERPGPAGQWRLRMRPDAPVDPVEASMRFREQSWVRWSQVDWIQPREERYTPSDDRFPSQWHLHNTGQGGGVPDADVNAPAAWDLHRGDASVIVAILDSGVELDHEDLEESLLPGYDFVDNDDDPSPSGSHGTSVTGAAAAPENGIGVVGPCPECSILPVRVIGASDSGEADAHIFAVDNGAWVINNSWGPPDGSGATVPMGAVMQAAIAYVMESGRGGKGTPVFWAAGNGHPTDTCSEDGFASHDDVIAIGASTNQNTRPNYSEICPELDLSAPSNGGSAGITTTRTGDGYTTSFGGTSAAAPVATGVGALVLSALPDLTASQLQALLESTAQKIDPVGGAWDDNGHSIHYGWGRIDAAAALQSELAFLDVPDTLSTCEGIVAATVSIPNGAGQGTVPVTAWSETESIPETFSLTEAAAGVYSGSITLSPGPTDPGDGFVSVSHGDSLSIASVDSTTTRVVALDCRAPELSSVTVDEISIAAARIQWVTDELADARASWGEGDEETAHDGTTELAHQIWAVDLEACTNHRVDLESADPLGNVGLLNNAVSFVTAGDPRLVPESAPEDADPCDPSTWTLIDEPPTPVVRQELTGGNGDGCESCALGSAQGPSGVAMLLVAFAAVGRRRLRS